MAGSRSIFNTQRHDYQPEEKNSQLFHRRSAASNSRSDYLNRNSDQYLDSHSNHYVDSHSDRYLNNVQGRQSNNVGDGWSSRLLDSGNGLLDNRSEERSNRNRLENEYDQYISELGSKSRFSNMALNNTNSDLERNSNFMDRSTVSSLSTNDRYANKNNTLSSLTKNSHLLEFKRGNLRGNLGVNTITPWEVGAGPAVTSNLHPLNAVSNKVASTLELANNLINLFQQQPQQNNPPSLLDLPVHAPQRKPFNFSAKRASMGNQQRTATDSRFGAGKRKSHWGPAGQSQLSKNLPRMDNNISSKPKAKTSNLSTPGNGKKTVNKEVDADYSDILSHLLSCHICKKTITKPKSFAIHLKGKVHAAMMAKAEEEYALAADKMREEIRAVEEMKPNRHNSLNFHCSMCNLDAGDAREHRSSVGHRKLKKYLHPSCHTCNLNFPTKILYDEHLLTVDHLKKLQAKGNLGLIKKTEIGITQKKEKDSAKVMQIFTMDLEKSYIRERFERRKWKKTTKDDKSKDDELKDDKSKDNKFKDDNSKEQNEAAVDSDDLVLDYMEGDDLSGVTPNMIPAYNTERAVGDSFLSEFRCVQCKLCNKLLDNEETAKIHLRTWGHHRQFTKLILNKIKGTKNGDDQQNKGSEGADAKEQQSNKDSGNWKRRKTSDKSFVVVKNDEEDEDPDENDENGTDSQLPPNDELEDWDQEDDKADIILENDDDVILVE